MHKRLAGLGLAILLVAACGGSSRPSTTEPVTTAGPSPCVAMAAHMKEILLTGAEAGDEVTPKAAVVVERIVAERCQADAWDPAVIDCAAKADDQAMDACLDQLTAEQQRAVEEQLEKELEPMLQEQEEMNSAPAGSAPPPPPAPEDPCGGGA